MARCLPWIHAIEGTDAMTAPSKEILMLIARAAAAGDVVSATTLAREAVPEWATATIPWMQHATGLVHRYAGVVYALFGDRKLLYIGKSVNFVSRIGAHLDRGVIPFDHVEFTPVRLPELAERERALIKLYAPPFNMQHRGKL
jgi:hypothetical protein